MTLGIAVFGALFTARLRHVTSTGGTLRAAYASGLDRVFLVSAIGALLGAVVILTLVRHSQPSATAAPVPSPASPSRDPEPATPAAN
jgi:hypothetical protein